MNREEQDPELALRQSVLYAVGSICEDAAQKQRQSRAKPAPSKDTLLVLADLVLKQAEIMATELQHFAAHANRKVIKAEDVVLCARKHGSLTKHLQKYQRDHGMRATRKRTRQTALDVE